MAITSGSLVKSGLLLLHAGSWCTPGHLLLSLSLHCFFCLFVSSLFFFSKYTLGQ